MTLEYSCGQPPEYGGKGIGLANTLGNVVGNVGGSRIERWLCGVEWRDISVRDVPPNDYVDENVLSGDLEGTYLGYIC